MKWVAALYPESAHEVADWVRYAQSWFKVKRPDYHSIKAICAFVENYLLNTLRPLGIPITPTGFLSATSGRGLSSAIALPSFRDMLARTAPISARSTNNLIHRFINHVLETEYKATSNPDGSLTTEDGLSNPVPYTHGDGTQSVTRGARKDEDVTLSWVALRYPHLEEWRQLAADWIKGETSGVPAKLAALVKLFDLFLSKQSRDLVTQVQITLARSTQMPDFYDTAGLAEVKRGIVYNNYIADFVDWVLKRDFSIDDDYGRQVTSPAFHNIVNRRALDGLSLVSHDSSVRSAMPYGLIHEARRIIVQGSNFSDWTWAQTLLGNQEGEAGAPGRDWFEVPEESIDTADPDCVFRRRTVSHRIILEMWSPVRYVALLVKLILPLRTAQVRVLDSGEADTWRFDMVDGGAWSLNRSVIAQGTTKRPVACGVFRRDEDTYRGNVETCLYINTNKTHDKGRGGTAKGYTVPWPANPDLAQNVYYWLTKLRNWQTKYNPITRRTSWQELDRKGIISAKHESTLAEYSDACFLFRAPEVRAHPHLPIKDSLIVGVWERLLVTLQNQLAAQGVNHPNGTAIELVKIGARLQSRTGREIWRTDFQALYDLHGLRVSLLTCLALEGEVPFEILQKLAGHSRLLMTLYYYKPGVKHIKQVLQEAQVRLNAKAQASTMDWLQNGEHKDLENRSIAVNTETLLKTVPRNPTDRNPAGWMMMSEGVCLAGGNTSADEVNAQIGGCHNGGPNIGKPTQPVHAAVPGGIRNCPRCRWFVTAPHYLPALVARFNNTAYHFDLARDEVAKYTRELERLREELHDAAAAGAIFCKQAELRAAERLSELHIKKFDDRCADLGAIFRLVKRCIDILNTDSDTNGLVLATDMTGLQTSIEETDGELLQLAWVCDDAEVYPDLDPGAAVLRRTQLLDMALEREGLPTAFMRLTPDEQLKVGNAFLRRLSEQMNPDDRWVGMRKVVEHMEAGLAISELPGVADALKSLPNGGVKVRIGASETRALPIPRSSR